MTEQLASGPRLRQLDWLGHDRCRAVFDNEGVEVEAVFELSRVDEIIFAGYTPNVMRDVVGTAAQHRTVFEAVIAFCLAAQGESRK
jgi:hypothetical protein